MCIILIRWLLQKPTDLDIQCFLFSFIFKKITLGSAGQGRRLSMIHRLKFQRKPSNKSIDVPESHEPQKHN